MTKDHNERRKTTQKPQRSGAGDEPPKTAPGSCANKERNGEGHI